MAKSKTKKRKNSDYKNTILPAEDNKDKKE